MKKTTGQTASELGIPEFVTFAEAARTLHKPVRTVRALVRLGKLKPIYLGPLEKRAAGVEKASLDSFITRKLGGRGARDGH